MSYHVNDQPWHAPLPRFDSVGRDEFLAHAVGAPVLLVVVTDIERHAVLRLMQPLTSDLGNRRLKGYIGQQTYYCGTFGVYRAVLTTCEMGSIGRDAAILSVQQAITDLSPGCVIMVGIAFGKDPDKQHIGQALVASQVVSYEQQRAGADVVQRGPRADSDGILKNRFRNLDHWEFPLPDGRACKRDIGPILSGEKLIDDAAFKARLFAAFPDAIGGEMEGAGLYAAAARARVPWILVKSICDWANGTKSDHAQPLAAATAASLVHAVLSDPHALDGIAGTELAAPAAQPPPHSPGVMRASARAAELNQADEDLLVEALMACTAMRDPAQRDYVLGRLDHDIQARVGQHETQLLHVTNIVKTCAAYPGGLEQLRDALARAEGQSRMAQQVTELIERLVGGHSQV
jgi:nucleoside phosphorylase